MLMLLMMTWLKWMMMIKKMFQLHKWTELLMLTPDKMMRKTKMKPSKNNQLMMKSSKVLTMT